MLFFIWVFIPSGGDSLGYMENSGHELNVTERGGVANHSAAGKLIFQTMDPHTRRFRQQNNRALARGILTDNMNL